MCIRDSLGSALVYLFIFIVVMFSAGTNILWFLFGAGAVAVTFPVLWEHFLSDGQKARILAPYDPTTVDPTGLGTVSYTHLDVYQRQPHLCV